MKKKIFDSFQYSTTDRLHSARLHSARLHSARLHSARLHSAQLHSAKLLVSAAALLCACLLFFSCTFDYGTKKETDSRKIPDFMLKMTSYTIERTGEHAIIFTADTLEMYESDHTAKLYTVSFVQRDDTDEELAFGSCNSAEINTNSRDAVLEGSIEVFSPSKGILLKADYLVWDNSSNLLSGRAEDEVSINYEDGSLVRGIGFRGDFSLNMFEFQEILEGKLRYD